METGTSGLPERTTAPSGVDGTGSTRGIIEGALPEIREALDPRYGKERRFQRSYRLNVIQIPAIRTVGFLLVVVAVGLHNRFLLHAFSWPEMRWFVTVLLAYSAVSWLVLALFYTRLTAFDLGELFLFADILAWTLAIYVSGGEKSLIFFVLIFRVADQTYTSFRRVLVFGHLSVLSYLLLVLYLGGVEHRAISWPAEATKLALLYSANFYIALTARPNEVLRRKVTTAIRVARDLILTLEEKSRQLERERLRAEAANLAKSSFLANMSHELRTPLNAVLGYSEMLQEELHERGQGDLVPDLKKIHGSGKHLLGLINEILDLSKIEAGKMDLFVEELDVAGLVGDVVATVRPLAAKNGNTLVVTRGEALGTMHADLTKVRQILLNLLSNAAKFTENGTITIEVEGRSGDGGRVLTFRVTDTGIGISGPELERLFEPFSQADASTARRYGGTGLGLTISKRFAQMMGGDISVESRPGAGSTFTLALPVSVEPSAPVVFERASAHDPARAAGHASRREGTDPRREVLVIDDDPIARDLISGILKREGFAVRSASGGEEALLLAHEKRPDLITLDVMMPGVDGWTVLAKLKSDPSLADVPVVMLTVVDERRKGHDLGADGYVLKPIERDHLATVLRSLS